MAGGGVQRSFVFLSPTLAMTRRAAQLMTAQREELVAARASSTSTLALHMAPRSLTWGTATQFKSLYGKETSRLYSLKKITFSELRA